MDADYDIFEIVAVIRDFWLVDSESYQRRYRTNHGQALAPGYYVVNWPEHIRARRFNDHAAFHGPFKLRKEAQAALEWMHNERELFLTRSAEVSSTEVSSFVAPNTSRITGKKAGSQKLRLVNPQNLSKPFAAKNCGNRDFRLPNTGKP